MRVVFLLFVFGDARFEELIFGDVRFVGQVDWVRCCREKCRRTAHALQPSSEMVLEPIIMLETNVSNGIASRGPDDNIWDSASTA
ncbi:hypothetical protein DKX38_025878 [Salix brachista]|uniref:Uncharacterized protein n=1 Tax=Salix brachista TaxID=2182728 RepID=A0A5N5JQR6_9ROSI|nr:hypothetical protein DKX38_025878 [Salix brachista]